MRFYFKKWNIPLNIEEKHGENWGRKDYLKHYMM